MGFHRMHAAWGRLAKAAIAMLASAAMLFAIVPSANADYGYDGFDSARGIVTGRAVSSALLDNYDQDWYEFFVPAAGVINLTFTNEQRSQGKWWVTLFDPDQQELGTYEYGANAKSHGDSTRVGVNAGTYWVKVSTSDWRSSDATGISYWIRANYVQKSDWETEWNDKLEDADALSIGKVVNGTMLNNYDQDWYRFSVPAAGVINLTFTNEQRSQGKWWVTLFDPDQQELGTYEYGANAKSHGDSMKVGVNAGTYWVKVSTSDWRSSDATGIQYALRANYVQRSDWETEWNDKLEDADALSVSKVVNGTMLNGYDQDWYKVTVPSTDFYAIQFANQQSDEGKWWVTVMDTNINELYTEEFPASEASWRSGRTVSLSRGTYYIKVHTSDRSSEDVTGIPYALKFARSNGPINETEMNDSAQTANFIKVNQTVNADMSHSYDNDWYKFTTTSAKPTSLTFTNASTNDDGYYKVSLINATTMKNVAAYQWSAKGTSRSSGWINLPAGTYYVQVSDHDMYEVKYTLRVNWGKPAAPPFKDVNAQTPHQADILWLANTGITKGYGDGTFGGMRTVVRQDMAAFLYRMAGSPKFTPSAKDKARFRDVNDATPHAKEIWWLASTGIAKGYGDGTFGGMRTVVRQDMAAFLYRYAVWAKSKAPTGKALDFKDVGAKTPHRAEIVWLSKTGVTKGYDDGTFGGMRDVVRQDMAAFLHRMKTNVLK